MQKKSAAAQASYPDLNAAFKRVEEACGPKLPPEMIKNDNLVVDIIGLLQARAARLHPPQAQISAEGNLSPEVHIPSTGEALHTLEETLKILCRKQYDLPFPEATATECAHNINTYIKQHEPDIFLAENQARVPARKNLSQPQHKGIYTLYEKNGAFFVGDRSIKDTGPKSR